MDPFFPRDVLAAFWGEAGQVSERLTHFTLLHLFNMSSRGHSAIQLAPKEETIMAPNEQSGTHGPVLQESQHCPIRKTGCRPCCLAKWSATTSSSASFRVILRLNCCQKDGDLPRAREEAIPSAISNKGHAHVACGGVMSKENAIHVMPAWLCMTLRGPCYLPPFKAKSRPTLSVRATRGYACVVTAVGRVLPEDEKSHTPCE